VSIAYEGDDLPGFRLPLGKPVKATVTVGVHEDAPGAVSGIAFAEGGILFEDEAEHVTFTENAAPDPFALDPGETRTFEVKVTGDSRGATALKTRVSGKDVLDRTAEAADREVVRVGEDLKVDVAMTPDELKLDLDEKTGRPAPKPVTITVDVENVSGEALTDGQVVLRRRVISTVARNPSAPYPLQVTALAGSGGAPDTPLSGDGALTVSAGPFEIGQKRTLTFRAKAADKAQVEVRADASATASAPPTARTVVGSGRNEIAIDQPKLLAVTAEPGPVGAQPAGTVWRYDPVVENISPDEVVLVRSGPSSPATSPASR
jgi:hypothetical protein